MTDMNIMQMQTNTLRELIEQREALDARIAEMRADLRADALSQARALVEEFELNAHELGLVKTQHLKRGPKGKGTFEQKAPRQPRPPMYRDPATGATWSGRGRAPNWMGENRDEFLIDAGSSGR